MKVTLRTNGTGRRLQAAYARAPQIVGPLFQRATERATEHAAGQVRSRAHPSFREHITADVQPTSGGFTGRVVGDLRAKPHMLYQEMGTRPHPIRPRRFRVLRFLVNGESVFARRVQHPGTKPQHFFSRGLRAAAPGVRRILAAYLGLAHRRLAGR